MNSIIKRSAMISLLFISLVGLSIYGERFNPFVTLRKCVSDPEKYDGSRISVGTEATVANILPNGFVLKQMNLKIPVYGQVENIAVNEFVNVVAIFHKDGYLELCDIYVAKKRRAKIITSIIPVIVIMILFFKQYRFDFKRLVIEEKTECRT